MRFNQSEYVLGYTDREQLRLIRQARVLASATEHFLRDAGIVSGMRVLDIGCGMGDVTMLVAQLIRFCQPIVSIDLDQASIEGLPRGARQIWGSTTRHSIERYLNLYGRGALRCDRGTPSPPVLARYGCDHRPIVRTAESGQDHGISRAKLENLARLYVALTIADSRHDADLRHFSGKVARTEMELPIYQVSWQPT